MPSYDWTCSVCDTPNKSGTSSCSKCRSPSVLSAAEVKMLRRQYEETGAVDFKEIRVEKIKKKRLTWKKAACLLAIAVGIFGMLDAAVKIYGGLNREKLESIFEAHIKFLESEMERAKTIEAQTPLQLQQAEVLKQLKQIKPPPEWYDEWHVFNGAVLIAINALYVAAAIMILLAKANAFRLLIMAAVASVGWTVLQVAMEAAASSFHGSQLLNVVVSIVFNGVIVAVVYSSTESRIPSTT